MLLNVIKLFVSPTLIRSEIIVTITVLITTAVIVIIIMTTIPLNNGNR